MTHKELIDFGRKWLLKSNKIILNEISIELKCSFVVCELYSYSYETPDIIGFNSLRSVLIECKTSRMDFKKDSKKTSRHKFVDSMGNLRFYLSAKDIIDITELPDGWGLLEIENNQISIKALPKWYPDTSRAESCILFSLVRRMRNKEDVSKYLF